MGEILIAEIGAGDRWSQANFDMATIEDFFEIDPQPGLDQEVNFAHVKNDGSLEFERMHPFISVPSQNYRFELGAAAGLPYPTGADRPIGVFWKKGHDNYWYRLLMPHDPHYKTVAQYLIEKYDGPRRQLRRIITSVDELEEVWPDSPFWI